MPNPGENAISERSLTKNGDLAGSALKVLFIDGFRLALMGYMVYNSAYPKMSWLLIRRKELQGI